MTIDYKVEKLSALLQDLANITGLSIALFSTDFKVLINCHCVTPKFCEELQSSPDFQRKCAECDLALLKHAKKSKKFTSHICHAGLADAVMPIIENNMILGYIMLGRMRNGKADIKALFSAENRKLEKHFYEMPYYDEARTESVANLASIIAAHIILGGMIKTSIDKPLEKATEYIESNLNEKLSLSKLCKVAGVNKNILYNSFKNTYGCTPHEYINNSKLSLAKSLLSKTELSVSEISERLGIENHTYFCQMFKKHTDISPLKYRKISKNTEKDDFE